MCLPISIIIVIRKKCHKQTLKEKKNIIVKKLREKYLLFETETKAPTEKQKNTFLMYLVLNVDSDVPFVSSNFEIRLLWTVNSSVKCGYCGKCSNCVFVLIFCYGYWYIELTMSRNVCEWKFFWFRLTRTQNLNELLVFSTFPFAPIQLNQQMPKC